MDGRPEHHLELTQNHWERIRFPGSGNMPPVGLLLPGPDLPTQVPSRIPWQSDNPDAVRLIASLSGVGNWAVDLTPVCDEELRFQTPHPHLYTYPPLALRLCCPAAPRHSDAVTAADFEQGTLW